MKLRILGSALRLRINRADLDVLAETGQVEERTPFGPEAALHYTLEAADGTDGLEASFAGHRVTVRVPRAWVQPWASSDRVGFSGEQEVGGGRVLALLVEKDFQCLSPREGRDDADTFPHPEADEATC